MSLYGNRLGGKRARSRSRSRSPKRHKHERDRQKRRSKERERETVRFDPHKRIKQEPVSPPPHHRAVSPPPRHRAVSPPPRQRNVSPPPSHRAISPLPRHRAISPPPRHHAASPPSRHRRSPDTRKASPVRDRARMLYRLSGRNQWHDEDDSSRRERHRRFDSWRPIKREPEDHQYPSQRNHYHEEDDSSRRERHRHFDSWRPIKREPEDHRDPSQRNHCHKEDDSSRRERHRHFDSRRPIKREPEDHRDPSQRQERERNDSRRRKARWEREDNDSRGSSGSGAASSTDQNWGTGAPGAKPAEKEKPNFELSGKLAEDTNVYNGVVIKYNEPPEARKPKRQWRFYPFKGEEELPILYVHRQSAYLIGRDRKIADFPVDHPSCSSQHAVLQYRLVPFTREDGTVGRRVSPYIIDLNSTNGTFLNFRQIEPQKYVELGEGDLLKFGYSTKEYVLLSNIADISGVVNPDES